jgi:L-serine dehydratase
MPSDTVDQPISILDIFSIGLGPSSSHTLGPMRAAAHFALDAADCVQKAASLQVILYGSLAYTGEGHGTDGAVLMGLEGADPTKVTAAELAERVSNIKSGGSLSFNGKVIAFDTKKNITFDKKTYIDGPPNPIDFILYADDASELLRKRFYSIGGGFITPDDNKEDTPNAIPYPFHSGDELFKLCTEHNMSVADVMRANEKAWRPQAETDRALDALLAEMQDCITRGCSTEGVLPGCLKVKRRACALHRNLKQNKSSPLPLQVMSWLNVYAMAVNEENAAGHRVVTAPTNGAAGIIPAVIAYYLEFCDGTPEGARDLLLTAGAIAMLYKRNASISGAEVGCQGEVGVASSMAAGALTAVLGGTIIQIENAAEIAMEHHLGMTCDPVAGLVQIPCIERNAMGANKAVNSAWLALNETGKNKVSLDQVIKTMSEIGHNMSSMYKETSEGGLANHVSVATADC